MAVELAKTIKYPALRKGEHALIKGFPCRIMNFGNCLLRRQMYYCLGIDIFTGNKYEDTFSGYMEIYVPIIRTEECELLKINKDDNVNLLCKDGRIYENIRLPKGDVGDEIKKYFDGVNNINVTVTHTMGITGITSYEVEEYGHDFKIIIQHTIGQSKTMYKIK